MDNHFEFKKNSCQKSIICEPEKSLNAINLNARCFAIPQHGRKKYWSYRDAIGTAWQIAKNFTTLIWGRLLCDATIKSYRVNKCTQVAGTAHASPTPQHGRKNTTEASATRPVPLNSSQKTTQLWYKADSCATSASEVMAKRPFFSGGSVRHAISCCPAVSLSLALRHRPGGGWNSASSSQPQAASYLIVGPNCLSPLRTQL